MKDAFAFRLKLIVAMMVLAIVVTAATLFFAERKLRQKNEEKLATQFQSEVRAYVTRQEDRLRTIDLKCRALSRSVRLRAALEANDADDLYRNALTELRDILSPDEAAIAQGTPRASFVRFLDANGKLIPPGDQPAGEQNDGLPLPADQYQASSFLRLSANDSLDSLRQIVVTRIVDWDGATLGSLVLGFPVRDWFSGERNISGIRTGLFFQGRLYLTDLSPADAAQAAVKITDRSRRKESGSFEIALAHGPHLLFYKQLASEAAPAFEVCLYPLQPWWNEALALRRRILGIGLAIVAAGFALSLYLTRRLARPVDEIVAGSVENLSRRQEAEKSLEVTNRELEKALAELKATQRQIIQQERLSAIGQMASGIAHDFNNSLTPILGFSELLLQNDEVLRDLPRARRFLEMLHTSAQDAASVVNRLREFYRPLESDAEFPAVDLIKISKQAIALTEPRWQAQAQAQGIAIEIQTEFHHAPVVAGEESALREVLTNLIFNAVDAMPQGGRITISTSVEANNALLRVRDSGSGMSEEVKQRCFEPFFSTKGERGTGLGLAMVYGIIERHRGQLEVDSALGEGTTFSIHLPLTNAAAIPSSPAVSADVDEPRRNILVVDDDDLVCEVMAEYLRGDGHDVATASNGQEAVAQCDRGKFDVVFLDRAMPGLSGDQTAALIKQAHADLPIIMLTGFGALIEVSGAQPRAVDAVLGKPVTLATLRRTMSKLLHAA